MFGGGTPVAMHFILTETPLGMVTTAPVVMETRSLMSVISNVPLTLLISGGTEKKKYNTFCVAIVRLNSFLLACYQINVYMTLKEIVPKFSKANVRVNPNALVVLYKDLF